MKTLKKNRRPRKEGYSQWSESEIIKVRSKTFQDKFFNVSVEKAKALVKKEFPQRTYDSVRMKIKYLEDKNKK